jgi:predicted transcriptional regulator
MKIFRKLVYMAFGGFAILHVTSSFALGAVVAKQAMTTAPVSPQETRATGKQIEVGKQAPLLTEDLSRLVYVSEKKTWTQKDLEQKEKISVLFYAAPGAKDLNKHVSDAIKAAEMSRDYYDSYAVVNMKASSWPNFIIAMKLKASQKEFPNTKYVRDNQKVLVTEWGLKDNSNVVILFGADGKVLFRYDGELPKEKVSDLLGLMKKGVEELSKKAQEATKIAPKTSVVTKVAA